MIPELFADADWRGSDEPAASIFAGADVLETETSTYSGGLRMRTKIGTEIEASLNSVRASTNSDFAALDPEYRSFGLISLRQPLLRGFGPAADRDLNFARRNLDAATSSRDAVALAVRAEVETEFWELFAAERNHAVAILIRDRAEAFLHETEVRASAGVVGPSNVANAEFFLTEVEQALLDTEERIFRTSDRIAALIGRRPEVERFRTANAPPLEFPDANIDSLVAISMRQNFVLQALEHDIEAQRELERAASWDRLPTLDLLGELGGNGLSGSPQDVYFPGDPTPVRTDIDGGRGDALGQAVGGDYPAWGVGVALVIPIGSREGRGELGRQRAEVVRAEQQLLAGQRLVEREVRIQYRELRRSNRRLELTTQGVEASIRQVEIGMLEYDNGRTTAFEVVRLAADLASAQDRYSQAIVRTARAAALLRQLTGGWYPGNQEH